MALEDRIRTSVDHAVQAMVSDLLSIHTDETSRQLDEAAEHAREIERRGRADLEQKLAEVENGRQSAIDEAVHAAVEAERGRVAADRDEQMRVMHEERNTAVAAAEARAIAETRAVFDAARLGEREAETAGLTRLVESVRGLDGATSLSEVLDALALAAARETARAAVVVVKGDHVVGWRLSGFGSRDTQPKSVDLALADAGVIGLAAASSRPATTQAGVAGGPGFEELSADRVGLGMPVVVGGRVVAVVYADGIASAEPESVANPWPEAIEVLARHAGRCLEALTARRLAAPASAARSVAPSGAAG